MINAQTNKCGFHHGDLRAAIIEEALLEAGEGTLESVSIRALSRRVGVSPAAVYRHFEDRDAILREVAEAGFDRLAAAFEKAVPLESRARNADEAVARFHALGAAYVTFAVTEYGLWRLIFGPSGLSATPTPPHRPSTITWLQAVLSDLAKHNVIAVADQAARQFAWASIHGLSDLIAASLLTDRSDDEMVARHCDAVLVALR